jgi:hypothetical protein
MEEEIKENIGLKQQIFMQKASKDKSESLLQVKGMSVCKGTAFSSPSMTYWEIL